MGGAPAARPRTARRRRCAAVVTTHKRRALRAGGTNPGRRLLPRWKRPLGRPRAAVANDQPMVRGVRGEPAAWPPPGSHLRMNPWLARVYDRIPGGARSVAASLRGLYLRSWRYGSDTERLVEQALERERWSAETWQRWQEERLAYVLERAATRVPYYRDQWTARRRKGDRASWELLENWPVLEKEPLRSNSRAFVAEDCNTQNMFHEHTSGTSGTPLDLWWSRQTVRAWYALFEARWRRWYGVSRRDRWAILGGQLVTAVGQRHPPFWVWNAALNQLYLSSYHLAPKLLPHFLRALERYRVRYLFGYPSALHALAHGAGGLDAGKLQLAVAITNAEPVLDHQRAAIIGAFGCPVRETYGMAEIVA